MPRTTSDPKMQDFARRLLAYESTEVGTLSEADSLALVRVSEKLRRPLCALAGSAGFRSLLARALTLAKREIRSLNGVSINLDGSLEGLSEFHNEEDTEAGVVLIAQFLDLLATFIGEALTLSLVHDAWPKLPDDERNSGK